MKVGNHFLESLARGLGDSALPFGGRVPLQASVVSERDEKMHVPQLLGTSTTTVLCKKRHYDYYSRLDGVAAEKTMH